MVESDPRGTTQLPRTFVRAWRRHPKHGAELAVLYALPHVLPEVERRRRRRVGCTDPTDATVDEACRRLVRRTVLQSRRDGAVTGTSFYVGMPAAMASTYLRQLLMVLEIATLHGHDPTDPARIAEILVIQGKYPTAAGAGEALAALGRPRGGQPSRGLWSAIVAAVRDVPSIIGVRVRSARSAGAISTVISVLRVVSYLIPVLSIPVCATSSARTTRHLGRSARTYYAETVPMAGSVPTFALPPDRSPRFGHIVHASLVVSAFAVAAVSALWVTVDHYAVRIGLLLIEVGVIVTFVRLWWITRPA